MINENGKIVVISGPSGSGKNTVYNALLEKCDNLAQTVSVTTRTPRSDETNGIDYYFVSKDEFFQKIDNEEFIEYVNYGDNYYGTLKSEVLRLLQLGKIVVMVIEVNGAINIKKAFPEATSIFILPPSIEELQKRILDRGENSEDEINIRLSIALEEIKLQDKYDFCVINDELNKCVEDIYNIIK